MRRITLRLPHPPPVLRLGGRGTGPRADRPSGPGHGNSDLAANLLAGVGFKAASVLPYFQGKFILKDGSEFVLAFGVRF